MVAEHQMIEPFEPGQVRVNGNGRIVSYGVSSYGYDVRCSDEFKIFTNINSAIVDPKGFDDKSFVDLKADVCIIPPNSFALARTVEYFRIPRNVLTICLGKSTYARCFRGDTRVALVDGTAPTLEEMARRADDGEMFWGYSIGEYGHIMVTLLDAPRRVGRDALIELILDNGESIHCTPDHEFILRNGMLAEADALRAGDSLMPLYRDLVRGHEVVYQPLNGHLYPTHRLADEWNLRNNIYQKVAATHRPHRDHERRNNMPWKIERMNAAKHIRHHNRETYGEDFDPAAHSAAIRGALNRLAIDPVWRGRYSRAQRDRALRFSRETEYAEARQPLRNTHLAQRTTDWRAHQATEMRAYYNDPVNRSAQGTRSRRTCASSGNARRERQRESTPGVRLRAEISAEVVQRALNDTGSIRAAARLLGCDQSVFRRFPDVIASVTGRCKGRNQKINQIRHLRGHQDVFCLTAPEAGNFALEAGVFVRNCGIIVNVTPLEPEWEGHVTLEFSNTTPLPAKVYANEGVAQVVFLESDEVCETSYKDRSGKYQGQQGVTLPKT
jgi:deoxycytidine triphosphate deaminase